MILCDGILPAPEDGDVTGVIKKLPAPKAVKLAPVGRWYEAYCQRRHHKQTLSHHSLHSSDSEGEGDELPPEDKEDEKVLMTLDPKEWKNQDHYSVLGIAKLRFSATDDQIKAAYKRSVLKHHPDKRRARGIAVKDGEEDYFTCITRAYETLGVPDKRRAYDSIDPTFDDAIPQINSEAKENFFETFKPCFVKNARWSNKKSVPDLGNENTSWDDVNKFYSFWYEFDSWREYSYLDEEDKEKGENREERRWIEKQNKAARAKRKKEEIARVRQLVDNAYACDPRIAKFKEEEKEKKLAQKRAKKEAAQKRAEEEERQRKEAEEIERKKREKEEEEARAQAAVAKKEKEAQKKAIKKERKTLRTSMKDFDYFATEETERVNTMQEVEKLAELLSLLSLQTLNESLTSGDKERAKKAFTDQVKEVNDQLEKEKQQQLEAATKQSGRSEGSKSSKSWSDEETQMLIKAVNLFPAGTNARWETVASFIKQHVEGSNRNAKEVLAKAKDLQKNDLSLKEEANKKAFDQFAKDSKGASAVEKAVASERYDSVAEQQIGETGSNPAPWSADEQKRLEQALKTYPASVAERWEKIAAVVPNRSKKDCMKRYKELVELVRAKKAAQAAALKDKKK